MSAATQAPPAAIRPTIGRVVWYYPHGRAQEDSGVQPHAATVAYVHSDTMVNLGYVDSNGIARNATSVRLVQRHEERPEHGYCTWMPYQVGQAAKAAQ